MNTDVFADWMRRQGYRVVRTESSYWYNAAPGVFQAFPYHWVITPTQSEIQDLLIRNRIAAVRYSTPFDFPGGVVSYHIVLREPYSLDQLKAQARNGVKAGLNRFKIEQISFERLATEGWVLQQDTLDRQDRLRSMTQAQWESLCRAATDLEGFEAWAATSDGELAAAVIVSRLQSTFSVPFAMSHRKFLAEHVNNALFYAVSKELLQRQGIDDLFFTVQSLDAPANVDEFKFRMGLQYKFIRQRVDFHPVFTPFASPIVHRVAQGLVRLDPSNPLFAKAEGMLRFHLEGRKPIEEQGWPERLRPERLLLAPPLSTFSKIRNIQITSASPFDLLALVDLHAASFPKGEHVLAELGKPFLLAAHRWFVSTPGNHVLVARQGDRIVGFTTFSERPYNLPLLRACWRELVKGCLRHPTTAFNAELLMRLGWSLVQRFRGRDSQQVAQIAFTAVDAQFQGQGIGRALKAASIKICQERGLVAVVTGVHRQNLRARQLNELAGFVEVPALGNRRLIYLRLDLAKPEGAP